MDPSFLLNPPEIIESKIFNIGLKERQIEERPSTVEDQINMLNKFIEKNSTGKSHQSSNDVQQNASLADESLQSKMFTESNLAHINA